MTEPTVAERQRDIYKDALVEIAQHWGGLVHDKAHAAFATAAALDAPPQPDLAELRQEWTDEAEEWRGDLRSSEAVDILAEEFGEAFDAGVAAMRAADEAGRWTCFHCGETYTDKTAALQHFGPNEMYYAACQIDIAKYREMEELHARNLIEDTERDRVIYRLQAERGPALQREEEKGYARGLADGRRDVELGLLDEARAEKKAAVAVERVRPIPMILYCPHCGLQHVDAPERERGWTNPPHKSHLCAECGKVWRPADVFTVGVPNIETMGKADAYNPLRAGDERVAAERARCAKIARRHGKPVPERPHDRVAIADNIAEAIERGGE